MDTFSNNFSEDDVRMIAHHYLQWHYRKMGYVYSETEAQTNLGKYADGFYAFSPNGISVTVAALECKKNLKVAGFRRVIHPKKLITWLMLASCLVTAFVFAGWYKLNQFQNLTFDFITIIFVLLIVVVCHNIFQDLFYKRTPWFLLTRDVFLQLEQYPADEQWLAFSKPINNNEEKLLSKLRHECKRRKIGLLVVDMETETVKLDGHSNPNTRTVGNFLHYYSNENLIYDEIMANQTGTLQLRKYTPSRKYHFWKIVLPALIAIAIAFHFRLTFEHSSVFATPNIQEPNEEQNYQTQQPQVKQESQEVIQQEEQEDKLIVDSTKVLLDNVYNDLASAEWRIKVLNEIDIDAKIGHIDDFETDFKIDKDYFVFLEDTEDGLRQVSNDYRKKLFDADLKVIDAEIVTILEQKNDK